MSVARVAMGPHERMMTCAFVGRAQPADFFNSIPVTRHSSPATWQSFRNLATLVKRTDGLPNDAIRMVLMSSTDRATRAPWVRLLNSAIFACTGPFQRRPATHHPPPAARGSFARFRDFASILPVPKTICSRVSTAPNANGWPTNERSTISLCGRQDPGDSKNCGDGRRRNNLLLTWSIALAGPPTNQSRPTAPSQPAGRRQFEKRGDDAAAIITCSPVLLLSQANPSPPI